MSKKVEIVGVRCWLIYIEKVGGGGFIKLESKHNILSIEEADVENVLCNEKLILIEDLLCDDEYFMKNLSEMNDKTTNETLEILRSVIYDFKNLMKMIVFLKRLHHSASSVSVSLKLNDALE